MTLIQIYILGICIKTCIMCIFQGLSSYTCNMTHICMSHSHWLLDIVVVCKNIKLYTTLKVWLPYSNKHIPYYRISHTYHAVGGEILLILLNLDNSYFKKILLKTNCDIAFSTYLIITLAVPFRYFQVK